MRRRRRVKREEPCRLLRIVNCDDDNAYYILSLEDQREKRGGQEELEDQRFLLWDIVIGFHNPREDVNVSHLLQLALGSMNGCGHDDVKSYSSNLLSTTIFYSVNERTSSSVGGGGVGILFGLSADPSTVTRERGG